MHAIFARLLSLGPSLFGGMMIVTSWQHAGNLLVGTTMTFMSVVPMFFFPLMFMLLRNNPGKWWGSAFFFTMSTAIFLLGRYCFTSSMVYFVAGTVNVVVFVIAGKMAIDKIRSPIIETP